MLERLCAGDWPGSDIARIQLASARYAGKTHPMDDESESDACFDIEVVGDVPLLDQPGHSHLSGLAVHVDGDVVGEIRISSSDGLIDSLEYDLYGADTPRQLPALDQLWGTQELTAWHSQLRARSSFLSRFLRWMPTKR